MSKRKSAVVAAETVDQPDEFVQSCWATLEGPADREALTLISTVGVFAVDEVRAAANILWDNFEDVNDKILAPMTAVEEGKTRAARLKALRKLEMLTSGELGESVDAAYLLGIAVGRRLGPPAPRPGGAR
jgi:hypothetical protein